MSQQPARLQRIPFRTSRLLDFIGQWPLVVLKELVDNALDAGEEAEIAPEILVEVSTAPGAGLIRISDNGPGISGDVVADILDFETRTLSREAYVSATRGQQASCYLSSDLRSLPDRFLILSDERVDVALSIRDFLQSQPNGAHPRALGYLIRIDRTPGAPADDLSVFGCRLSDRLGGQSDHTLLQMLQTHRAQNRPKGLDQTVKLAVTVPH